MSCPDSDSVIYITKSVTWDIKNQSAWVYSSPTFDLNNQECIITVNISSNGYRNQYIISSVEIKFTKSCASNEKIIVILNFGNELSENIFYALPVKGSNVLFSADMSRTITESTLRSANCSVSAMIVYQKLEDSPISTFFDDMKSLLKSEIHSDFQIKAGDTIFKVHKALIATRSDVLKSMVENDMLEKKTSQLELLAAPVVVHALLEYLYTNTCTLTAAPTELFKLAHFLDLKELQICCKNYLLSNIHLNNIVSILELTSYNNYNLKDLHDAAMKFVNEYEKFLIKDLDFKHFLCNYIKLENITFILKLSYKHKLDICLNKAMEFIRINYETVLKDAGFKTYIKGQPTLNLKILQYCLDFYKADSNKKE